MKVGYSIPPAAESGLGIDHSQRLIRIGPVPFFEVIEGLAGDALVAIDLVPVCRLHQKTQLDGAHLRLIRTLFDLEARADSPGKIVDVIAVIGDGLCAIRIIDVADLHTAGADDLILRHRELHVVDAEVGEEFCGRVILVAVPRAVPPHADLRETTGRRAGNRASIRSGPASQASDREM